MIPASNRTVDGGEARAESFGTQIAKVESVPLVLGISGV